MRQKALGAGLHANTISLPDKISGDLRRYYRFAFCKNYHVKKKSGSPSIDVVVGKGVIL